MEARSADTFSISSERGTGEYAIRTTILDMGRDEGREPICVWRGVSSRKNDASRKGAKKPS